MNFLKAFRLLRTTLPFFKSVFRAYKETTGSGKPDDSVFSKYFSKVMTQSNLGAPPIMESTALEILNIEKTVEEVEPRQILERYYILFKKNDPRVGGTTYLQSKVFAAKECLMARFPDAEEHEQLFYKEVVEPEEKAEQEEREAAEKEGEGEKEGEKGEEGKEGREEDRGEEKKK